MIRRLALVGAGALSLALSSTAVAQAPTVNNEADIDQFARVLAGAARAAETGVDPQAVRTSVTIGVQGAIASSGQSPTTARLALQRVLLVCQRRAEARLDFACPGREGALQGVSDVLNVVIALLDEQILPAAGGPDGPSPFALSPGPVPGGGGTDYPTSPG